MFINHMFGVRHCFQGTYTILATYIIPAFLDIPVRRGEKQSWGLRGFGFVSNYLPLQPRLLGPAEMEKT